MKTNLASDTLLLLGGAAAGAIAMYLLDPDQGSNRRTGISSRANQAAVDANASIHSQVDRARTWLGEVGDSARKMSHGAADQVTSTATQASEEAHSILGKTVNDLVDRVQHLVDRAKDYADHTRGRAMAGRDDLTNRANSFYGRAKATALRRAGLQEAHPYRSATGHTVGTAGILAIGAGLMFFFDPAQGRGRRAWLEDKVVSLTRKANKSVVGYGRHVGNKIQGAVAEAKNAMPDQISEVLNNAAESAAAVVSHHGESESKPM